MNSLIQFIISVAHYTPFVSFFGAIIGGEETLIFLAILSAQNLFNFWYLFIFFYFGIVISDTIWYFLGKSQLFDWLVKRRFISKVYLHWDKLLNKATQGKDFQALFITKFLYGFRLPTIMYLSKERMKLKPFLIYTAILNFIWVVIISTIGWFAGKGISLATNISNNLILYLFLIGLTLLLFTIVIKYLSNLMKIWLEKKQEQ